MTDEITNQSPTGLTLNNPEPIKTPSDGVTNETLAAQIAQKIKSNSFDSNAEDLNTFETKKKVDNVKQKVYVFGLIIIGVFVYQYANSSFTTFNANKQSIVSLNSEIAIIDAEINQFNSIKLSLNQIAEESDTNSLIGCINNPNLCEKIYDKIPMLRSNLEIYRSYLLLTPLSGQKMEIDQKSILKYFNEYLLRDKNGIGIGQLLNISFSNPSVFDQPRNIYAIDVDTTITFPSKDAMMSLIDKIETGLDPNFRLLIKIKAVNYDIVKYEEPQTVDISFTIYHYKIANGPIVNP